MRTHLSRITATGGVVLLVCIALAACATVQPAGHGPLRIPVSASPSTVLVAPAGAPKIVPGPLPGAGAAPDDPGALSIAKTWMAEATPPPGARVLDTPPAGAPAPATLPACDWLVRATAWWSTPTSNAAAAETWLTSHPASGLAITGTTSMGDVSSFSESDANRPNATLAFVFAPSGSDTVIRVDATLVPKGAGCASGGGAVGASG